jgi:hypothetical protein
VFRLTFEPYLCRVTTRSFIEIGHLFFRFKHLERRDNPLSSPLKSLPTHMGIFPSASTLVETGYLNNLIISLLNMQGQNGRE